METRETSRWLWALLLVAADVTGLVVVGALAYAGVLPAALAGTLITGILAGSRLPAAVRVIREGDASGRPEGGPDDDPPPPGTVRPGRERPRLRLVTVNEGAGSPGGTRRPALLVTGAIFALVAGVIAWAPFGVRPAGRAS